MQPNTEATTLTTTLTAINVPEQAEQQNQFDKEARDLEMEVRKNYNEVNQLLSEATQQAQEELENAEKNGIEEVRQKISSNIEATIGSEVRLLLNDISALEEKQISLIEELWQQRKMPSVAPKLFLWIDDPLEIRQQILCHLKDPRKRELTEEQFAQKYPKRDKREDEERIKTINDIEKANDENSFRELMTREYYYYLTQTLDLQGDEEFKKKVRCYVAQLMTTEAGCRLILKRNEWFRSYGIRTPVCQGNEKEFEFRPRPPVPPPVSFKKEVFKIIRETLSLFFLLAIGVITGAIVGAIIGGSTLAVLLGVLVGVVMASFIYAGFVFLTIKNNYNYNEIEANGYKHSKDQDSQDSVMYKGERSKNYNPRSEHGNGDLVFTFGAKDYNIFFTLDNTNLENPYSLHIERKTSAVGHEELHDKHYNGGRCMSKIPFADDFKLNLSAKTLSFFYTDPEEAQTIGVENDGFKITEGLIAKQLGNKSRFSHIGLDTASVKDDKGQLHTLPLIMIYLVIFLNARSQLAKTVLLKKLPELIAKQKDYNMLDFSNCDSSLLESIENNKSLKSLVAACYYSVLCFSSLTQARPIIDYLLKIGSSVKKISDRCEMPSYTEKRRFLQYMKQKTQEQQKAAEQARIAPAEKEALTSCTGSNMTMAGIPELKTVEDMSLKEEETPLLPKSNPSIQ